MSTEQPKPARPWGRWLRLAAVVLPALISGLATHEGCPKTVEVLKTVEKRVEVAAPTLDEFEHPATGWVLDPEQIAENLDPLKTLHFADTPAGKAAKGDEDVFLYRLVRKAANRAAPWYPNINQGSVGCCVGAASKHGSDAVQAGAIAQGARFDWKPVSAEVIYAGSRIDVGRGQIRGDGSLGRWACEYLRAKGGMVPMEKVGQYDLTTFSAARAREWGSRGVPAEVSAVAKQHPVSGAALVKSAADVERAIGQLYPVVVCSDVGFDDASGRVGSRDAQGFIKPRGTWPHAMCFIGWRNGDRPGALCLNSWGDSAHGGPVWPEDAPRAAFWVDAAVVDRMVKQGDSFALSGVQGFPSRKVNVDWFVNNRAQEFRPVLPMLPVALAW